MVRDKDACAVLQEATNELLEDLIADMRCKRREGSGQFACGETQSEERKWYNITEVVTATILKCSQGIYMLRYFFYLLDNSLQREGECSLTVHCAQRVVQDDNIRLAVGRSG